MSWILIPLLRWHCLLTASLLVITLLVCLRRLDIWSCRLPPPIVCGFSLSFPLRHHRQISCKLHPFFYLLVLFLLKWKILCSFHLVALACLGLAGHFPSQSTFPTPLCIVVWYGDGNTPSFLQSHHPTLVLRFYTTTSLRIIAMPNFLGLQVCL